MVLSLRRKLGRRRASGRELVRAFGMALTATAAGGISGLTYATQIEPAWVETTEVQLELPRLPEAFDGYRIVQISDFHIQWMPPAQLFSIVEKVNNLAPDLIAMTGDYVTRAYRGAEADLVPALSKLRARDGITAVLGNHDYWGDNSGGLVRGILKQSGAIDVNNKVHTIERDRTALHLAGVDSVREGEDRLDLVLQKLPNSGAAILLVHEPDFADRVARTGRFDLQISGHSHGGQVVVPFVGPPHLPPMGRKYYAGLYHLGDMLEYTNRGLGVVGLPVRFFCRPEITVFTLASSRQPHRVRASGRRGPSQQWKERHGNAV